MDKMNCVVFIKKPTVTLIELKNAQIKLHSCVQSLVVESHKLATRIPVNLRQKVRAVNPETSMYVMKLQVQGGLILELALCTHCGR